MSSDGESEHSDSTASLSSESIFSEEDNAEIKVEAEDFDSVLPLEDDKMNYPPIPKKRKLHSSTLVHQAISCTLSVANQQVTTRNILVGLAKARRINTFNVRLSLVISLALNCFLYRNSVRPRS
jgi:hypothetical protein